MFFLLHCCCYTATLPKTRSKVVIVWNYKNNRDLFYRCAAFYSIKVFMYVFVINVHKSFRDKTLLRREVQL